MPVKPRFKQTFGGCTVEGTSPPATGLSPKTSMLNVWMPFEEALKLSLAIQECVRKLNTYDRSTKLGKRTGLNITVHLHKRRITVNETTV